MVLPAPAADAASPAAPWLDRLTRIFHLGQGRGVLVLVRGGPERLGELVRCVVGLAPDARVLLRADEIASLPPGSTAVLCLRREDFDWLNVGRPSVLGHRIVLFGDAETALAMERRAVDFCDWISHRIDAPLGPPAFAVRAIRNASCARSGPIVWKDGDIEPVFTEALPGRRLEKVSAAQPYSALLDALRPRGRTWVLVTDLEEAARVPRVWWAMAEARRYGRVILHQPKIEILNAALIHGMPAPIGEAARKLEQAGIEGAARVAALLELEPSAIERAVAMASSGASGGDIEGKIDALVRPEIPARDVSSRSLPGRSERVAMALSRWDFDAALHWARSWLAAEPGSPRAKVALAHVFLSQEKLDDARALLREAIDLAGPDPDADTAFEVRRLEALLHNRERKPKEALRAMDDAIRLLRKARRSDRDASELHSSRFHTLVRLGRLDEAEQAIREWSPHVSPTGEGGVARDMAVATLDLMRGDLKSAMSRFEPVMRQLEAEDSPSRDAIVRSLAYALMIRGAFADAERLTREAARYEERRDRHAGRTKHQHARALIGLGRFEEAERELLEILASLPRGETEGVRHDLVRSLRAQGKLEEAEIVLDEAIAELRGLPFAARSGHLPFLYERAYLHSLRGEYERAASLVTDALREEERAHGKDHPALVRPLTALGDSLIACHDPAAAQPHLRRAQRIAERSKDDVGLASALGLLAIAEAMQKFPQAAHSARRALEAWSRTGQEMPPEVREDLEAIAAGDLLVVGEPERSVHRRSAWSRLSLIALPGPQG